MRTIRSLAALTLSICILAAMLPAAATSDAGAINLWGMANADRLNVRTQPLKEDGNVITRLSSGDLIFVLAQDADKSGVAWYHVRLSGTTGFSGAEGWIMAQFVNVFNTAESAAVDKALAEQTEYTAAPADIANAKPGDAMLDGHRYRVFHEYKTWANAKTYCESLGGHLTTITSQQEQDVVFGLIADAPRTVYYLGGTDEGTEGDWRWITGEPWSYERWAKYEPDNWNGIEHYLKIFSGTIPDVESLNIIGMGSFWGDGSDIGYISTDVSGCWKYPEQYGFLCEWEPESGAPLDEGVGVEEESSELPTIEVTCDEQAIGDYAQDFSSALRVMGLNPTYHLRVRASAPWKAYYSTGAGDWLTLSAKAGDAGDTKVTLRVNTTQAELRGKAGAVQLRASDGRNEAFFVLAVTNGALAIPMPLQFDDDQIANVPEIAPAATGDAESAEVSEIAADEGWLWPVPDNHAVYSPYPNYFGGSYHSGIDISKKGNYPVLATRSGVVVYVKNEGVYKSSVASDACQIVLKHTVAGQTVYSQYVHLVSGSACYASGSKTGQPIRVGDTVTQGEQIGLTGATGAAGGDHLHFGLGTEVYKDGRLKYKAGRIDPRPLDCVAMRTAIVCNNRSKGIDKDRIYSQVGILYKMAMDD